MTFRSLLSHNVSRVLASASISLVLRYEAGSVGGAVWGFADGLVVIPTRAIHFVFRMYSRVLFFAGGWLLFVSLGLLAVLGA